MHPVWVGPSPGTPRGVRGQRGALHTEWEVGGPAWPPATMGTQGGSAQEPTGSWLTEGTSSVSYCYCCHCSYYCTVTTASGTWQSPGTPAPQRAGVVMSSPL